MIISVANKKGGVGKTTIATNLACYLANSGYKVVLIDADEQASSMSFQEKRPDDAVQFQTVSIITRHIFREATKFDSADYVILDVPAKDSIVSRNSMACADRVIVPVQPSQYDLLATKATLDILDEMADTKGDFKFSLLRNMVMPNPNFIITKETDDILVKLKEVYGVGVFESSICHRVAYKNSAETGLSVAEMKGEKYIKARDEFNNFYNEVLSWV